ncbi:hypothetical protein BX600DRAFT_460003 [Xylariales sp. PMI_506]|nr:hypothetical protein BX600DRAFT_460003 [Xylariales sp. PMI_506]
MKASTLFPSISLAISRVTAANAAQHPLHGDSSRTSSLLDLHKSLIEIPSISGSERGVSDLLKSYLRDHGFTVEAQSVGEDGQENVFAYLGNTRATRILVTSHIDTVPPFTPYERKGDEIWGRGSADAKGSVAAQIEAVKSLIASGTIREGDAALLFVGDEEAGGSGMRAANDLGLSWESVIFGEPTELKLARGHKGGIGFVIKAAGKDGHSGYPELGSNAIDLLVRGLWAVQQVQLPSSERFGNTTINVGRIEGGVAGNVIPGAASASGLIRVAVDDLESITSPIRDALKKESSDLDVEFPFGKGPVPIDYDIDGFETAIENYGTDIVQLNGSHKRYLYGPGSILLAHSDHEHISVKDLEAAVEGYKTIITEVLKR